MAKKYLKGGAMLSPLPAVLVSVGDMENANLITIAWTGILATHPPRTYISVRPERHSYKMLKERGEFVINLPSEELCRALDYAGVFAGAKVDKFEKLGLHKLPSKAVSAPTVEECKLALECRVVEVIPMGTHDVFIADILGTTADEALFDAQGKLHMEKAGLVAYAHGEYFSLGKRLGRFGFSATKKKKGEGGKKKHPIGEKRK